MVVPELTDDIRLVEEACEPFEMAGRVADRAAQALGGRGYMVESRAARFFRELRVDRIWEGTSEIQRSLVSRGVFERGAAPHLGWE